MTMQKNNNTLSDDDKQIINELNLLLSKNQTSNFSCIIGIGINSTGIIIDCPDLFKDIVEDIDELSSILTDDNGIPVTPGVYRCIIEVHSYQSNSYDDPIEYDMTIAIKSYELISNFNNKENN